MKDYVIKKNRFYTDFFPTTTKSLIKIVDILEVAIAIVDTQLSPSIVSEDWLKTLEIIPQDWQLSRAPIINPNLVSLTFDNQINIIAQSQKIIFVENITHQQLAIPLIAEQYLEKVSLTNYQAYYLNLKRFLSLPGNQDTAKNYITESLLAEGSWRELSKFPVRATVNFFYQLDHCQFNLSITEATFKKPDKSLVYGLLFNGSFQYNFIKTHPKERLNKIKESINNCAKDLAFFQEIVDQKFLG